MGETSTADVSCIAVLDLFAAGELREKIGLSTAATFGYWVMRPGKVMRTEE